MKNPHKGGMMSADKAKGRQKKWFKTNLKPLSD